jgi:hypothetical protein
MHTLMIILFAVGAGMTAAGVISNAYRLLANEPSTRLGTVILYAVMVVAGPAVLAGNSTKSFKSRECSKLAYALALVLSLYWSFATGLFILSMVVAMRGA